MTIAAGIELPEAEVADNPEKAPIRVQARRSHEARRRAMGDKGRRKAGSAARRRSFVA